MQIGRLFPLTLLVVSATIATPETHFDTQAIRLNNRGVAQMGQQFTDRAAKSFAEAFKKDPKLAQAAINEGIALMTLQKLDEAKKAFKAAIALDPNNAQAWYNLGLAQHADNELEAALASFQQAVKFDPAGCGLLLLRGRLLPGDEAVRQGDRDSEAGARDRSAARVVGVCAGARAAALRRHTRRRKEHFKRFQHLTSTKISRADRAGIRRAGTLLDGDAGRGAGGATSAHDSGASW